MAQFQILTATEAMAYANLHSDLFGERSKLTVTDLGKGHMNQLFRVQNQTGHSLVVKQALPFARGLNDRWPLSLDRSRIEAQALLSFGRAAPGHVVEVLHYEPERALILLEDLQHYQLLNLALIQGKQFHHLGQQLAELLAAMVFTNSDFALDTASKKARQLQFLNPEPAQIVEDMLFNDPFSNSERNQTDRDLTLLTRDLWSNEPLQAEVARLKAHFRSQAQTLCHGDLAGQSIFINETALKIIDAEFAGFGPAGFDAGLIMGSLMVQYCTVPALQPDAARARDQQHFISCQIKLFWQHFQQHFLTLCQQQCRDPLFGHAMFQQHFLSQMLQDWVGYAGCQLIRRTLGFYTAAQWAVIKDANLKQQARLHCLRLGQQLILQHRQISQVEQVLAALDNTGAS